jgi:hypothetical protein
MSKPRPPADKHEHERDEPAPQAVAPKPDEPIIPPVPKAVPEGSDALRRRGEWFTRRTGRQPKP